MGKLFALFLVIALIGTQGKLFQSFLQLKISSDEIETIPTNEADSSMIGDLTYNSKSDYVKMTRIEPTEGYEGVTWQDIEGDDYDEAIQVSDNPDVYSA
ncbi:unnamed protein product [Blepharisma stoltei]|uniref:Uncharacterized protein n=1 Tax=Blepharisma stoltei TaxID=1481888 RepID=A0AAU9JK30_9CILI|nr:unnamed protein product [Blepharisma stoltei]